MAWRISGGSGNYLSIPAGLSTSTFSISFWIYPVVLPNNSAYKDILARTPSGITGPGLSLFTSGGVTKFNLGDGNSDALGTTSVTANTWYYLTWTCGSSVDRLYVNGVQEATDTLQTADAALRFGVYFTSSSSTVFNGRFANVIIEDATWTAAEVLQQYQRLLPQRAPVWAWYATEFGATERVLDRSGNARNVTATGTITDEDPPPVSYGAPVWLVGTPATGGAVTINATAGTLTLAGQQATVTPGAVSIAVSAGALTLAGQSASVQAVTSIGASAGALALAGQSATVVPGAVSVAASAGALALAGQQATVTPGAVSVAATAGSLALAGQSATVDSVTSVAAAAGALTLTGQSATVTPGAVSIAATAGTLTLAGQQATVAAGGPTVAVAAGTLTLAGLDVTVVGGRDPVGRGVVWVGTFESQNEDELESDLDSGPAETSGTNTLSYSTTQAHSGTYSAKLVINTGTAAAGIRLFRKKEIWENSEPYYYSAWFYFPSLPTVDTFFNIFQFKYNLGGASEVAWKLEANNFDVGAGPQLGLRLVWDAPIDGPFEGYDDTNQGLSFYQGTLGVDSIPIPMAQWVHFEGYLEQSEGYDGRIMFWQDGVQVFDVHDIRTKDVGSNNNWSVNNYGNDITPNPWTIYIDDMVVSTERSYPTWFMPTDSQQPDATAGVDGVIRSSSATTNFGTSTTIRVGEVAGSAITDRGLFKPDLSGIPAGATIHSCMLSLMVTGKSDASNNRYILAYRQKRAWTESGATWNKYDGTNNWGAAGGFDPTDCEQTAAGQIWLFQAMQVNKRVNIMLDCSLVQEWVDGTFANNGVLLKSSSEVNDAFAFGSSDNATAGNRPLWQIIYSVDVSIAANPGTLTLSGQQATVTPGAVSVAASAGTLALAGQQASATAGATVSAAAGALSLAGQQASVVPGAVTVTCSTGALTLAGQTATVSTGAIVSAAAGALALTGQSAAVTPGAVTVQATAGALALVGALATVTPGAVGVNAQAGSLALSGQSATVDAVAGNISIDVAAGVMSLAGQACSIEPGAVIVVAAIASLAIIGRVAGVTAGITRGDWDVSDAPKYQWEITDAARYIWTLTDSSR